MQNWRSNFVLFQGVNEANSHSYLTISQRRKRAKEQAKMYKLFLYNFLSIVSHAINSSFIVSSPSLIFYYKVINRHEESSIFIGCNRLRINPLQENAFIY